MKIIPRAKLSAYLASPEMDPTQEYQKEFQTFATVVNEIADPRLTYFVHSDNECGADPELVYSFSEEADLVKGETNNGYFGVRSSRPENAERDSPVTFYCYMGGSRLSSASGFCLTGSQAFDLE